jgi:HEAT repeat protein
MEEGQPELSPKSGKPQSEEASDETTTFVLSSLRRLEQVRASMELMSVRLTGLTTISSNFELSVVLVMLEGCCLDVQLVAIRALGRMGKPEVVPSLRAIATTNHPMLRHEAITALSNIVPLPIDAIRDWIKDDNEEVREEAAALLCEAGKPAVSSLLDVLADGTSPVESRRAAAIVLGKIADRRAVQPLCNALADVDICATAADALGSISDSASVVHLIRAFHQGFEGSGLSIVKALLQIRVPPEGVWPLLGEKAVLHLNHILRFGDEALWGAAVDALAVIGGNFAVWEIVSALEAQRGSVETRLAMIAALGSIKGDRALATLDIVLKRAASFERDVQDSDLRLRSKVVSVLSAFGQPAVGILRGVLLTRSSPPPLPWYEGRDFQTALLAVDVLGSIGTHEAAEALCLALSSDWGALRQKAVETLADMGEVAVWPLCDVATYGVLPSICSEERKQTRSLAASALGKIGDLEFVRAIHHVERKEWMQWIIRILGDLDPDLTLTASRIACALSHKQLTECFEDPARVELNEPYRDDVLNQLCRGLANKNSPMRNAIVKALVHMGAPSVSALCPRLKSRDEVVASGAALALGGIAMAQAVLPLCNALRDPDSGPILRREAARALGEIKSRQALKVLMAHLWPSLPHYPFGERSEDVREAVKAAIKNIKDVTDDVTQLPIPYRRSATDPATMPRPSSDPSESLPGED